eukprot:TRINITY_DN3135_c0_g1_i1.p1 TRINITY_DN3135_c0_g1~~TRINITY_DN3135_c0_g1_i1.p1  ORF type:complete len:306 (-),score=59.00 TRINITY_DN3135_c0_g1_i1:58-975(-)
MSKILIFVRESKEKTVTVALESLDVSRLTLKEEYISLSDSCNDGNFVLKTLAGEIIELDNRSLRSAGLGHESCVWAVWTYLGGGVPMTTALNFMQEASHSAGVYEEDKDNANIVNIVPANEKRANYWRYCTPVWEGEISIDEELGVLREYTGSSYRDLNLALMFDHKEKLANYGERIRKMKRAIRDLNVTDEMTLYRGASMTTSEVRMMKDAALFFIPNFVSTSKEQSSAFQADTVLVISKPANTGFCADLEDISLCTGEKEILLSCYNIYLYVRDEVRSGLKYVYLEVADYDTYCMAGIRQLRN